MIAASAEGTHYCDVWDEVQQGDSPDEEVQPTDTPDEEEASGGDGKMTLKRHFQRDGCP